MTIDLQTLKCGECGSSVLKRTGLNEYTCEHCGSVTLVEDNVSDRLERVLDQVKNEAGRRLAADEARRQALVMRKAGIAVAAGVAVVLVISLVGVFVGGRSADTRGAPGTRSVVAAVTDRTIPTDGLKLGEPRQVLVGSGSSARPKLLVVARNETGKPLARAGIRAVYYDGDSKLDERSEMLPLAVLEPGESAPLLIDMPSGKNVTRQELRVQKLSEPYSAARGPRMAFSRARLVQQGERVRLVGRVVNDRKDAAALGGIEVLVTLYDDAGQVIGFGQGYGQANEIAAGAHTSVDVSIARFGRAAAIAAWDYRIGYSTLEASGGRTPVLSADRVIRTAGGPENFNPDLRLGTDDLLAEDSERFDDKQLELLPLVDGRNNIQQRLFLGELVNRSADAVVLAPGGVISRYSGNKFHGTTNIAGLAYLYPGERFPIFLEPEDMERITLTRIEWKPMRRAALPGPRKPMEVKVTDTRAETGSVLLNFSQRFTYKSVEVTGSVKNPGNSIVGKVRLWVSLRDRNGQLTGFKLVDNLPAIAPGESVPFQVNVEQNGRDFASVTTLYQTE
jgi:DNA-directed RNA polymerase subunit RPC12/RpoP